MRLTLAQSVYGLLSEGQKSATVLESTPNRIATYESKNNYEFSGSLEALRRQDRQRQNHRVFALAGSLRLHCLGGCILQGV